MKELIASTWELLKEQAAILLKSGFLPVSLKTPEQVLAVILRGRELGMSSWESLESIDLIEGRPTLSPQGMIALAQRSGKLEDLAISDDGNTCTVVVKRVGLSPHTAKFSMQDADRITTYEGKGEERRRIPLSQKFNWKQYPSDMRQWRAVSKAFRVVFADVIGRMYSPEEMGASVDADGNALRVELDVPRLAATTEEAEGHPYGVLLGDAPAATSVVSALPPAEYGDEGWFEKNAHHDTGAAQPESVPTAVPAPFPAKLGHGIDVPSKREVVPPPTNAVVLPKASSGPVKAPFTIVGQAKSVMDVLVGLAKLNSYALDKNGEVNLYHLCAGIRMGGFNPVDNKLREVDRDEAMDALAKRIYDKFGKVYFSESEKIAPLADATGDVDETETGGMIVTEQHAKHAGLVPVADLIRPAGNAPSVKQENLPGE